MSLDPDSNKMLEVLLESGPDAAAVRGMLLSLTALASRVVAELARRKTLLALIEKSPAGSGSPGSGIGGT
jgi:hypothetical protein